MTAVVVIVMICCYKFVLTEPFWFAHYE